MIINKVAITGYKAQELGIFQEEHPGVRVIQQALEEKLRSLIEQGLEWVLLSGQLGVETWAADVVISLQKEFPQLHFAIVTPFLEQEKNWNDAKKEKYQEIMQHANFTSSITNRPYEAPWQFVEKNKWFLTHSDALLIVYDDENEGSPKYMYELAQKYMENHAYECIKIDAYDLQMIAEEIQMKEWNNQHDF